MIERIRQWFSPNADYDGETVMRRWDGAGQKPLTRRHYRLPVAGSSGQAERIARAPLFSEYLNPCVDVAGKYVLMRNFRTVGMMFEILPLNVEGRSQHAVEASFDRIRKVFTDTLPEETDGCWIIQFFLEDERSLEPLLTKLISYIPRKLLATTYTQDWLGRLEQHLQQVGQDDGLFFDQAVANAPWRGRMRRARCCLWKHLNSGHHGTETDIDRVAEALSNAFAQSGIVVKTLRPAELYAWLSRWFVPRLGDDFPAGMSVEQYLRSVPWKSNGLGLIGDKTNDIAAASLHGSPPTSDLEGNWYFRGLPTRFLCIEEPSDDILTGVLSAEQSVGAHRRVLWDAMPAGSVFSMTMTVQNQNDVAGHVRQVASNSVGDTPIAAAKRLLADEVLAAMARGEKIHRLFCGVFVRGENKRDLNTKCSEALSLLNSYNLKVVPPTQDPLAQDTFLRALPFGYDPEHDARKYVKRSRFWYASHIAKLAPVLGRGTGTGNPGLVFYNRGADPLTVDMLAAADRKRNAHALVLGPTGSGKTSLIIYILMQLIAVHKPRIFLISSLPTFKLFTEHLKISGLSVNHVRIGDDESVALPPFADAGDIPVDDKHSQFEENFQARDVLADLELQAMLMITGGEAREEEAVRRSDRTLIRQAIRLAAKICAAENRQVLTEDVIHALRTTAEDRSLDPVTRRSLDEKARAMALFCDGLAGRLFNRPGTLWPDVDVTAFELGPLAAESAKDCLSIAVTSLLSRINAAAQREQHDARQIITIIDEAHILLKNPLITPYLNNITAMWRTYGSWLWIATQTLQQFPAAARELLQQPEWWICMTMNQAEIHEISRFKKLTEEEKSLLSSARKETGKYTEGVILGDSLNTLFRNVVPALALALAQTEKHEKAARRRMMQEHRVTELQACYRIAEQIIRSRRRNRTTLTKGEGAG